MFLHVVDAQYLGEYCLWLKFNNGAEGEIDLAGELEGEVFGPLRDLDAFKRFTVDPEIETVVWENGADFAPEFLYEQMTELSSARTPAS